MMTLSSQTNPKRALLIIDPQNDFVASGGALSVAGAEDDAGRLASLMSALRPRLDALYVSLDSHHKVDISHPLWFEDARGVAPEPFTQITSDELRAGLWRARGARQERTLAYLEELERRARYPHVIWPEHCLIGAEGRELFPTIYDELQAWCAHHAERGGQVHFVTKGESPWTEHFSAVEAEVPDPHDPHTQVNQALIEGLLEADEVLVAGWARSHCVGNTVRDLIRYGGPELAQRLVLVSDTMSDVPGFEALGERFTAEVIQQGVRVSDCAHLKRT